MGVKHQFIGRRNQTHHHLRLTHHQFFAVRYQYHKVLHNSFILVCPCEN